MPDLPETRYDHGTFVTEWGSLAVCGGFWSSKPWSTDCLVLNASSKEWERGILGGLLDDAVRGVNGTIFALLFKVHEKRAC